VVIASYNHHVRLLSPELLWLVGTTEVYSGLGADIVMESITLKPLDECYGLSSTVEDRSNGMLRNMMLGMIRQVILPLLLVGAMSSQDGHDLKIRIVFPEGLTEKASMTYLRRDAVQANSHGYYGVSFHSDHSFVEAPATTKRFTALVWAPGCKMKHFNLPVEKSDITLQFACDPINTVSFHGRVKGVEVGDSATISVSYTSMETCMWLDDPEGKKNSFCCSCGGPQIGRIASAPVAPDGTFKLDLPDFSADPIVSGDGTAELEFQIGGLKDYFILQPQPAKGIETKAISIGVAPSYPEEVTFLAVSLKDFK
jgi:hypothetical protein